MGELAEDDCAVCLGRLGDGFVAEPRGCFHLFHANCITRLQVCPLCRSPAQPTKLATIYCWGEVPAYPSVFAHYYGCGKLLDPNKFTLRPMLMVRPTLSPPTTVFLPNQKDQNDQKDCDAHWLAIEVRGLDGTKFSVKVHIGATFRDLKLLLAEATEICAAQLRLVYRGAPVNDAATFKEQKLSPGDIIHFILQITGS